MEAVGKGSTLALKGVVWEPSYFLDVKMNQLSWKVLLKENLGFIIRGS